MGLGMAGVKKAQERAENRAVSGAYLPKIYWADKKDSSEFDRTKMIRFLSDDVVVCKVYEFVSGGKEGKGRDFVDPASLVDDNGKPIWSWVNPQEDFFRLNEVHYPDYRGNLKSAKEQKKERIYALAIVREEYQDENGKLKVRDKMVKREWEQDGQKKEETAPYYGHIKQAVQNFWNTMFRFYQKYGTITDRDYEITRNGNGTDTAFTFIQSPPEDDLDTPEKVQKRYKSPVSMEDFMKGMASYEAAYKWIVEGNSTCVLKNPQNHARYMDADKVSESEPAPQSENTSPEKDNSDDGEVEQPKSKGASSLRDELESLANS